MFLPENRRRPIVGDWLLLVLLAASLAANVYFGLLLAHRPAATSASERPAGPAVGSVIKTVEGVASDGTPLSISLADGTRRTVLFVYSPACAWCKRSWPLFQRLSSRSRDRFNTAAVCLGKASEMFQTDVSTLGNPTLPTVAALRSTSVPQTIVFSPEGHVERVWIGGWTGDVARQLGSYFGLPLAEVSIPGEQ
jgi:hypothetical protein